jgi:hypothetical protein
MIPHLGPLGWLALLSAAALVTAAFGTAVTYLLDRDPVIAVCDLRDWTSAIPALPQLPYRAPQRIPAAVAPDDTCDQLFPAWLPWDAMEVL